MSAIYNNMLHMGFLEAIGTILSPYVVTFLRMHGNGVPSDLISAVTFVLND